MSQIGTLSENSLHAALKGWYGRPGDRFEVSVDGFVIDIVRDDLLIEIQTRHLYALRPKLAALLPRHPVRLVHPIPREKWIVRVDANDAPLSRRKSPKRGSVLHLFDELVRLPTLLAHPNLTLEALLTRQEEVWRDDGQGSWRRRRWSVADRRLLDVGERALFGAPEDLLRLLPAEWERPFTNQELAAALHCPVGLARKMSYTLRQLELLAVVGKRGREHVHVVQRP